MKIKHKLVTAAITVALTMTSAATTIFAKTTFDDMIFDLQSLNIMTGDENGDLQLDKPVTRAEFASIVVRMMSMQDTADSYSDSRFDDVPEDYWAKGSINFLSSINVISGTSQTTFAPEDNIDIGAASKILVCALGYDSDAKMLGAYPTGYLAEAGKLDLLDTVDTSVSPLSRREVAKMVYNALDVDIMTLSSMSNGYPQYTVDKGNTFRNKFKSDNKGVITKLTGLVTATSNAYLNDPVPGLDDDEIEINGALYQISNPSYAAYLGQKVDFFVEDENSNVIISMQPSNKTTLYSFSPDDIVSTSSGKITYNDESGSRKTIKYDKNGYFIYNNRVTYDWSDKTLDEMKNGSIVFIDNDDDNIADVIIAKEYSSVVADRISEDGKTIFLKDGQTVCGQKYIKVDPDSNQRVTLADKDGNPINSKDVQADSVLSCYISPDEEMIEVIVSDNMITDTISAFSNKTMTIGGTAYDVEDEDKNYDVKVGDTYDIYLNFNNEVAYIKKPTAKDDYAYVSKLYLGDDKSSYYARLVIPNTIQEKKEEEKDEDGGAAKVVSKLACQNSEVIEVKLADNISINGIRYKTVNAIDRLEKQIISYTTNSKDEVSKVTTPLQIGTGRTKYYNSSERTFGKTTGGAFGVDMDTLTICIPKDDPDPSEDDLLTAVEMNNGQLYEVKAYDRDDDTHMARLIAVTMTMKSGTKGLINTSSKVGMVQSCVYTLDEESNEMYYNVDLLTDEGNSVTYRLTDTLAESDDFEAPSAGDLIAYSLDIEYQIDAVKVLGSMGGDLSYGRTNARLDYETFCGFVGNIEYNQVSENLNRWIHLISCTAPSGDSSVNVDYEVLKNSGPPIFIYDQHTKESSFGTIDDIDITEDEIFVSAANSSVRAIVILR